MALFKPGPAASAISGKTGGTVFSHNRGGQYMRQFVVPTNPASPQQQAVRTILSGNVNYWNNLLTAAQRAAWDTYALNTPITNRLGDPINVGGLGMYNRANVPALQASLSRIDDAPTIYNTGEMDETLVATVDEATDKFDLAFDDTLDWCDEDGSALLIYASRPQNASINFFKGPYRFAHAIEGDSTTPPTSPENGIDLPFPVASGNRVFFRARIVRADGRVSDDFRFFDDA